MFFVPGFGAADLYFNRDLGWLDAFFGSFDRAARGEGFAADEEVFRLPCDFIWGNDVGLPNAFVGVRGIVVFGGFPSEARFGDARDDQCFDSGRGGLSGG